MVIFCMYCIPRTCLMNGLWMVVQFPDLIYQSFDKFDKYLYNFDVCFAEIDGLKMEQKQKRLGEVEVRIG